MPWPESNRGKSLLSQPLPVWSVWKNHTLITWRIQQWKPTQVTINGLLRTELYGARQASRNTDAVGHSTPSSFVPRTGPVFRCYQTHITPDRWSFRQR